MKHLNLKKLGLLSSTALLTMALLTACGGDAEENTPAPDSSGETQGQSNPSDDPQPGDDGVDNDMSLESEDENQDEEDVLDPEDVENSDPNATPPEEDGVSGDNETTPSPEPEAPAPAPEATPEATPAPEAPAPAPEPAPEAPSASSVNLGSFYSSTIGKYEFAAMDKVPTDFLVQMYPGLTSVGYNQREIYMPMMSATACEIALIEVQNASDVDKVKAMFQARINEQADGGAWYPEAMESWKNSSAVVSNGNVVMMIAHPNYSQIVADFNALF